MHEDYSDNYARLLEPLGEASEAGEPFQPGPGDSCAWLDAGEGAWYRARVLAAAPAAVRAALLDAARVTPLTPADRCVRLPADFAGIPEFCCHLESDAVQLKDQLQCTIVSKSGNGLNVTMVNLETGAAIGTGVVRRWLPEVEYPQEKPPAAAKAPVEAWYLEHAVVNTGVFRRWLPEVETPQEKPPAAAKAPVEEKKAPQAAPKALPTAPSNTATGPAEPPQVARPPVTNNSCVVLLEASEPGRVFVRPGGRAAQAQFDEILFDIAKYGADECTERLSELPAAGQTVLARFSDGAHYRALVQRVSSKMRRCLLEYIEYGNAAIVENLDDLRPCPAKFELANLPTLTSMVSLQMKQKTFSEAATAYLNNLRDNCEELTLTIPSGEKSGPTKTPVRLTIVQSKEEVNRTVDSLSTPEWQKILERGGDIFETESLHFNDITYVSPPADGGELDILDCSMLPGAMLSGHLRHADHAKRAFSLAPRLEEYCNSALAKDPYLPKAEELCIAMCPIKKQWLRAVLLEQVGGAGGSEGQVLFYDYGHILPLPITSLRKMMPEFGRNIPAAVCAIEIKDFPKKPTPAQLEAATRHLQLNEKGIGTLKVTKVTKQDIGEYLVEAPDLIRAMQ